MRFSIITLALFLAVTLYASPLESRGKNSSSSSASTSAAGTSAAVLTKQAYNDFQVSDGVGGNALAEVNAKFPVDQSNLAGVPASDLAVITSAAKVAEDAETETGGFNDAIEAAGGKGTTAGAALQVGKIKNKVLKLQTDILRIQIEAAQGNDDSASELAGQQKKLANNVKTDVANAGLASTPVDFSGTG